MADKLEIDVYLQDPMVAEDNPLFGFDEIKIEEEPVIFDGPTSARFAVVDYNGTTGILSQPAEWDAENKRFIYEGKVLDRDADPLNNLQYHQVQVWATLQRALRFFEDRRALGRTIPWAFEGNRLIVVPHAGFGKNAYYDRISKSLQFYYYSDPKNEVKLVYTCLSADIIHHEFGHAILDGIRPYFMESSSPETSAFHEFLGDMTAILSVFRNNSFRKRSIKEFGSDLSKIVILSRIADEFGTTVKNRPYLRSAENKLTMSDLQEGDSPHHMSNVLTGAIFRIIEELSKQYIRRRIDEREAEDNETNRHKAARSAFFYAADRMHRMALQPLDYLPPIEATFKDYALAMLRAEEIANPRDPYNYRKIMLDEFVKREIFSLAEQEELSQISYPYDRRIVKFPYAPRAYAISRSKGAAYSFLDGQRKALGIPKNRDIIVTGVHEAQKVTRADRYLPKQYFIQYIWHEEVLLDTADFLEFFGATVAFPCGGTLVFDEENNVLHWANKAGIEIGDEGDEELLQAGLKRLEIFKSNLKKKIQKGLVGLTEESEKGLFEKSQFPWMMEKKKGLYHVKLTPHLDLSGENKLKKSSWEISL